MLRTAPRRVRGFALATAGCREVLPESHLRDRAGPGSAAAHRVARRHPGEPAGRGVDAESIPGQTTCGVVPSLSRPLVVEWSALDRACLESASGAGQLVAVNYVGYHIEVLPIAAPARFAYVYTPTTTKRDTVSNSSTPTAT